MNNTKYKETAPFQTRLDGVIPFGFFLDFLEFIKNNNDIIEVITYADLDWGEDWNYENNYLAERQNWQASLKDGRRDPNKIYLFLQHDVDSNPERTINAVEAEYSQGIRSNIMIFNKRIDRKILSNTGKAIIKDYNLDRDFLKKMELKGFVIGYHCNALERAEFNRQKAIKLFSEDIEKLSELFDIHYFSPHGGVRGPDGFSNVSLGMPLSLKHYLKWVHNGHTVRMDGSYSDGGLNGKRPVEDRDPREFVKTWQRGKRYRMLFHPQYYHTPYSDTKRLLDAPWYWEILKHYGRGEKATKICSDDLLDLARNNNSNFKSYKKQNKILNKFSSSVRNKKNFQIYSRGANEDPNINFNPIFIGGDGRSGTTLLSVILNSHPLLAVGSELHFNGKNLPNLGPYLVKCLEIKSNSEKISINDSLFKPGIQFINRCDRSGISPKILKEIVQSLRLELGSDFRDFQDRCQLVKRFGEYNCNQKCASRWGFKIMREIKNISKYGVVWPEASFIHIIRDGRDVAASQIKENYNWGYADIEKSAYGWVSVIEKARKTAEGFKYRELKYERLIKQPIQTLKRLMAWLGEPWDDKILRHNESKHAFFDSKVRHPSRDQVAKPINDSAVGRYKKDLTPDQISLFESIAGNLLEDLGYKNSEENF